MDRFSPSFKRIKAKAILFALVLLLITAVFIGGCTTLGTDVTAALNFACKPTAAQTQAAQVGETLAQTALTALATLSGNLEAAALSQVALPLFQSIIAGVCATQANWDAAVNALTQANLQPVVAAASTKAMAPSTLSDQIIYLKAVKWSK